MARYCPYCVSKIEQGNTCPYCDGALRYRPKEHHLKPGTLLNNKYLVGRALGEGGFGITYVGRDLTLDMKVAIKEYYPNSMATRSGTADSSISLVNWTFSDEFKKGREQFINEAQTIAKMDKESAVVTVRDFFEQNNSAYIVMEFVEGEDLRTIIKKQQKPMDPETLLTLLEPVFGALDELHGIGLIHRDISPDNIMIENDRARLIDFGCARETLTGKQPVDAVLKHSFSPIEQYENRNMGPWTDVYAMAATIYYCITGRLAPKATDRVLRDELAMPSAFGVKLRPKQEKALMKALAVNPQDRYRSMAEFGKDLFIHKNKGRRIAMLSVAAAVLAVAAFFIFKPEEKLDIQEAQGGTYEIVTLEDKLSEEEEKELRQIVEMVSNLTLVQKKEGYSTYFVTELENSSDYDFEHFQPEVCFYDADGVNIGTSWGDNSALKRGESKGLRFSSYGSSKVESAEIRAIVRDGDRGLDTGLIPIEVSGIVDEPIVVELQNQLPDTITYENYSGEVSTYSITDVTFSTTEMSSDYWLYGYIAGTFESGPANQSAYLKYQVLNEDGEEVAEGSVNLPKLREGDRFENADFTCYSLPAGHYTVVLLDYKR